MSELQWGLIIRPRNGHFFNLNYRCKFLLNDTIEDNDYPPIADPLNTNNLSVILPPTPVLRPYVYRGKDSGCRRYVRVLLAVGGNGGGGGVVNGKVMRRWVHHIGGRQQKSGIMVCVTPCAIFRTRFACVWRSSFVQWLNTNVTPSSTCSRSRRF